MVNIYYIYIYIYIGAPYEPRTNAEFRGTISYASLNAHLKKDLSRRDDLWSYFFTILDFFDEPLPWRALRDNKVYIYIYINNMII